MAFVKISDLDRGLVLAGLYNAARPQGMGFMSYNPAPLTAQEAANKIGGGRLDYVYGRVMKLVFHDNDDLDVTRYDRDNGDGAAQAVLNSIRATGDPNNQVIQDIHKGGVVAAAAITRQLMAKEDAWDDSGPIATVTCGLAGAAPVLGPKVDEALRAVGDDTER